MPGLKQRIEKIQGEPHPKGCKNCGYCDSLTELDKTKVVVNHLNLHLIDEELWVKRDDVLKALDSEEAKECPGK